MPVAASWTAWSVAIVANASAALFWFLRTAIHLHAHPCVAQWASGSSRRCQTSLVLTLPLEAAIRMMGRLSPTMHISPGCPVTRVVSAMAARSPNASAVMLELAQGAATRACARHGRCPSSSSGPHSIAPAPAALGPVLGRLAFGDLCLAPPSKATRCRGVLSDANERVWGGEDPAAGPRCLCLSWHVQISST